MTRDFLVKLHRAGALLAEAHADVSVVAEVGKGPGQAAIEQIERMLFRLGEMTAAIKMRMPE